MSWRTGHVTYVRLTETVFALVMQINLVSVSTDIKLLQPSFDSLTDTISNDWLTAELLAENILIEIALRVFMLWFGVFRRISPDLLDRFSQSKHFRCRWWIYTLFSNLSRDVAMATNYSRKIGQSPLWHYHSKTYCNIAILISKYWIEWISLHCIQFWWHLVQ